MSDMITKEQRQKLREWTEAFSKVDDANKKLEALDWFRAAMSILDIDLQDDVNIPSKSVTE